MAKKMESPAFRDFTLSTRSLLGSLLKLFVPYTTQMGRIYGVALGVALLIAVAHGM